MVCKELEVYLLAFLHGIKITVNIIEIIGTLQCRVHFTALPVANIGTSVRHVSLAIPAICGSK